METKVFFTAFIFLFILAGSAFTLELGDADGNGKINIIDALVTAQYAVGLSPANFYPAAADVIGCDGVVNIIDALAIAKYYVGMISSFPCEQQNIPYFIIEYVYSGGFAGWTYDISIDSSKNLLIYNETRYTLTDDEISRLGDAVAALYPVRLPMDKEPCCCDRFAYNLIITSPNTTIVDVMSAWTDCTLDLPAELTALTSQINDIISSR